MEVIYDNENKLAVFVYPEDFEKHFFVSDENDALQVGVFKNKKGDVIQNHIHNIFERVTENTQELIYVVKGRIQVNIHNREKEFVCEREIGPSSMVLLIDGGHGFTILEDDTIFVESKNGPYFGVEKDKVKF